MKREIGQNYCTFKGVPQLFIELKFWDLNFFGEITSCGWNEKAREQKPVCSLFFLFDSVTYFNSFEELEINIEGYPKLEMCRSLVIFQTSHKGSMLNI